VQGYTRREIVLLDLGRYTACVAAYDFEPRWKEELVCAGPAGRLVFELTMGVPTVYFPTEEAWVKQAPPWAQSRRDEILAALRAWCGSRTPVVIDATAGVSEDR